MLLDERDDIIGFLLRRLKAALPVLGDNELVTSDPFPFIVQHDIGRVSQTVTTVADIPGISEKILDA
jgi:hypothetical protein